MLRLRKRLDQYFIVKTAARSGLRNGFSMLSRTITGAELSPRSVGIVLRISVLSAIVCVVMPCGVPATVHSRPLPFPGWLEFTANSGDSAPR